MSHLVSQKELEFKEAVKAVIAIYEANHGVLDFDDLCHDHGLNAIQAREVYRQMEEEK